MKRKTIVCLTILYISLFLFNCAKGKFDLQIDGKEETRGADVYINGSYSGKMKPLGGYGSHYGIWLPHGSHVIEIKKDGYQTYKEVINIKETESEYYMDVKLEKEKVE
ncbi:MAG: PEGA domain-containing protein [candidate division Zixibacteria bacterium]|nr:PEGA domain-containing protein [candidate division Zixibacteria bacterium]